MSSAVISGSILLDKMVTQMPADERAAFAQSVRDGFLVTEPEQRQLQTVWTLWCMREGRPDIRVERTKAFNCVTMHMGTCKTTLSADGMVAIKRAFERSGGEGPTYQTRNWCKRAHVPADVCADLANTLAEIAYLDGVPLNTSEPI